MGAASFSRGALATAIAFLLGSCGGGPICLNCTPGTPTPVASVTVTGNVLRFAPFVNPSVTTVTVIVCVNLGAGQDVSQCPEIFLADVDGTSLTFTRPGVAGGPETIFFWIDQNNDGMVNPTDPISQLQDPNNLLADVQVGMTVTVGNAVVDFTTKMSTATISVTTTPTATPTPSGSPTPTPTVTGAFSG